MSFNQLNKLLLDWLPFLPDSLGFVLAGILMAASICTTLIGIGSIYTWFER